MRTGFQDGGAGGGGGGAKSWLHMIMSGDQTTNLTAGNVVLFDTKKAGEGISDDGFGFITLEANKTYRIDLMVGASWSANSGDLGVDIYDYTGGQSVVSRAYVVPPTFTANITRGSGSTYGIIKPTQETIIGARITLNTLCTKIYAEPSGTRLVIQEV